MNKLTPIFVAATLMIAGGLDYAQSQINEHGHETTVNHGEHGSHSDPGHGTTTPSDDPVIRAFTEVNDKMHANMAIEFTGDADVDFMRGMIPHHQGAIDMAKVVLEHGKDPEVRKLAEEVISVQEGEITMIKKWLADRGQ